MAPLWVLLDRHVNFVHDCSGPTVTGGSSRRRDYDEILAARAADMKAMKPNLDITNPPKVSRLSMVRQIFFRREKPHSHYDITKIQNLVYRLRRIKEDSFQIT
jgi:hypothetical protein